MSYRTAVVVCLSICASAALSAAPMKAGKWQITLKTIAPVETGETVTEVCLEKDTLATLPSLPPNADCKVANGAFDGVNLNYTVNCGRNGASATATFAFDAEAYSGTIERSVGGKVETRQKLEAHRIGVCDQVSPEVRR